MTQEKKRKIQESMRSKGSLNSIQRKLKLFTKSPFLFKIELLLLMKKSKYKRSLIKKISNLMLSPKQKN